MPDPLTMLALVKAGVDLGGAYFSSRDYEKWRKQYEQRESRRQLANALSGGRFAQNPVQSSPKAGGITRALGAASTGLGAALPVLQMQEAAKDHKLQRELAGLQLSELKRQASVQSGREAYTNRPSELQGLGDKMAMPKPPGSVLGGTYGPPATGNWALKSSASLPTPNQLRVNPGALTGSQRFGFRQAEAEEDASSFDRWTQRHELGQGDERNRLLGEQIAAEAERYKMQRTASASDASAKHASAVQEAEEKAFTRVANTQLYKDAQYAMSSYARIKPLFEDLRVKGQGLSKGGAEAQVMVIDIMYRGFGDPGMAVRGEDQKRVQAALGQYDALKREMSNMTEGELLSVEQTQQLEFVADTIHEAYTNSLRDMTNTMIDNSPWRAQLDADSRDAIFQSVLATSTAATGAAETGIRNLRDARWAEEQAATDPTSKLSIDDEKTLAETERIAHQQMLDKVAGETDWEVPSSSRFTIRPGSRTRPMFQSAERSYDHSEMPFSSVLYNSMLGTNRKGPPRLRITRNQR